MKAFHLSIVFHLLLVSFLGEADNVPESNGIYIVYMGASRNPDGGRRSDYTDILNQLMKRKKNPVVETYTTGFSGFAAYLSNEEANTMAQKPGVVSVFPDSLLQLLTTRSWDFLKGQTHVKIDSSSISSSTGDNTIIGVIDTGIWPESDSFHDDGLSPVPTHWKGVCMKGENFTSTHCNKKIIGARYYDNLYGPKAKLFGSARDTVGHGTHVASTAAGRPVPGASYYGLANGTASGGSSGSRLAVYCVCTANGCPASAILKAFDDAIADEVDVLSLSLGMAPGAPHFDSDPISIGSFHATQKGIIVVCAAGNSGPYSGTVVNIAPWILTVAATSIDRDLASNILLAGKENTVIKGGSINFSNLSKTPVYPLVDGHMAKSGSNRNVVSSGRDCLPGTLDAAKVKGKIVLCENTNAIYHTAQKFERLKNLGGVGMIVIDDYERQVTAKYGTSPVSIVTKEDGDRILSYINSTSNPLATILPTETILNYKPAPVVAAFSARGPTMGITNLLNPDVAAPGLSILAAFPPYKMRDVIPNKDLPLFDLMSGTSMACPHVSALAATIKSENPMWSPSAIKSAIMTTAIHTNNMNAPMTVMGGSKATAYDIGAGNISPLGALEPGLVYETEIDDYIQFLCNMGYSAEKIRSIAGVPAKFSCPADSKSDLISDMNYPSIAVSSLKEKRTRTVKRTLSNLGEQDSIYIVSVEAPAGLNVGVVPDKLQFTKYVKKLSFRVTFTLSSALKEDVFGSITWSNTKHKVRSPFVVTKS